jgi:hypothetical protein
MNGEVGNGKTEIDIDDDVDFAASPDDTVVITEDVDDLDSVDDISAEFNVEELVAKLDKDDLSREHRKAVRRRLEELEEQRRAERELDSTFNFNLDDEI